MTSDNYQTFSGICNRLSHRIRHLGMSSGQDGSHELLDLALRGAIAIIASADPIGVSDRVARSLDLSGEPESRIARRIETLTGRLIATLQRLLPGGRFLAVVAALILVAISGDMGKHADTLLSIFR
jgi:hypothetical protein